MLLLAFFLPGMIDLAAVHLNMKVTETRVWKLSWGLFASQLTYVTVTHCAHS